MTHRRHDEYGPACLAPSLPRRALPAPEATEAVAASVDEVPAPDAATPEVVPTAPAQPPAPAADDALDLGATVLPVLARQYGPPLAGVVVLLLIVRWLVRRR